MKIMKTKYFNQYRYLKRYKHFLSVSLLGSLLSAPGVGYAQVFQAEDYTYFNDTTAGNAGGAYRSDDVDIQVTTDEGGGYNVGWMADGEWLVYSDLSVPTSGEYIIKARVASPAGGSFSLDLNSGDIPLGRLSVPSTGDWQNWTTISTQVHINAGTYNLGLFAHTNGWNLNWLEVIPVDGEFSVTYQAEDYDSYYDSTPGNEGGAYRQDDVDIEVTTDTGGGYNVGWAESGERLTFNGLEIQEDGQYQIEARVASESVGGTLSFNFNNGAINLGQVVVPDTGDWQNWRTVSLNVELSAGSYSLNSVVESGPFNLNWIRISEGAGGCNGPLCADKSRGEWTLLVVPDTQHYSQNRPTAPIAHMQAAFDWIVSIKDQLNIRFVQGLGDITEDWDQDWEWQNSTSAWYKLYGQVPFMPIQGNHDAPYALNKYFPVSSFSNEYWYGGDFGGIENNYGLITIGNEDYMFLQVEAYDQYSPYRPEGLAWAKGILATHPNRKVILASHDIWATQTIKNELLTQFDNIVMANAGHDCVREASYVTTGPNGGVSHNFVADYQCDEYEVMLLRFYKFKPMEDRVEFYTYSPITGQFESDSNSQGSFPLIQANP